MKVGLDITGGTNFLTFGTTQFMSVPYALHANTVNAITIDSISQSGNIMYLSNGLAFNASPYVSPQMTQATFTLSASNISSNQATLNYSVASNMPNSNNINRGLLISTSPNPTFNNTIGNQVLINNSGLGVGNFNVTSKLGFYGPSVFDFFQLNEILKSNTTYFVRAYATEQGYETTYSNVISFTTLPTGQTGPGGGIVFYDKGNNSGGWQYLEAAPNDQGATPWQCPSIPILTTNNVLGEGQVNTSAVVSACGTQNSAAKLCDDLVFGGQSDWYLPNAAELQLAITNLHANGLGNFTTSINNTYAYWTSVTYTAYFPYLINFSTNAFDFIFDDFEYNYKVRAVRRY